MKADVLSNCIFCCSRRISTHLNIQQLLVTVYPNSLEYYADRHFNSEDQLKIFEFSLIYAAASKLYLKVSYITVYSSKRLRYWICWGIRTLYERTRSNAHMIIHHSKRYSTIGVVVNPTSPQHQFDTNLDYLRLPLFLNQRVAVTSTQWIWQLRIDNNFIMRESQTTFKTVKSSTDGRAPKEVSCTRDDNPESRASRSQDCDIEQMFAHAVEQLEVCTRANQKMKQDIQDNELNIVGAFQAMLSATQLFHTFSEILYKQTESLLLYRSFRSLYEAFSGCSTALHKITSRDKNFNHAKVQYLSEQTRLLTTVGKRHSEPVFDNNVEVLTQENQKLRETFLKYECELKKAAQVQHDADFYTKERVKLTNRIAELEEQLSQNNLDFSEQIKMYNKLVNHQEVELRNLSTELAENTNAATMRQLRTEVSRCKDQIFQDQLLIESLTRKIKLYQKDRLFKEPVVERALNLATSRSRQLLNHPKPEFKFRPCVETGHALPY